MLPPRASPRFSAPRRPPETAGQTPPPPGGTAGGDGNGGGVFREEDRQLRERINVLQRPKKIGGGRRALRLIEPGERELADDGVVFQTLRFLQFYEGLDADGANRPPLGFHQSRRGRCLGERTRAPRTAHHVQKNFARLAGEQDKVKAVPLLKMFGRERRGELVVTCPALTQSREETIPFFFRRVDPEIDVLGKYRRAVKDGGLAADAQMLDAVSIKALEKVCDHARLSSRAAANASASCAAAVRGESGAARFPSCRARPPRPASGARGWHQPSAGWLRGGR